MASLYNAVHEILEKKFHGIPFNAPFVIEIVEKRIFGTDYVLPTYISFYHNYVCMIVNFDSRVWVYVDMTCLPLKYSPTQLLVLKCKDFFL